MAGNQFMEGIGTELEGREVTGMGEGSNWNGRRGTGTKGRVGGRDR